MVVTMLGALPLLPMSYLLKWRSDYLALRMRSGCFILFPVCAWIVGKV